MGDGMMKNTLGRDTLVYKKIRTIDEQVEILVNNKNFIKDSIDDNAKDFLLRYNYINVITPFKYKYAELKIINDRPHYIKIKIDNVMRHAYNKEVDFKEIENHFMMERASYQFIASGLITFETTFKSLVNYYLFTEYKCDNDLELICTVRHFIQSVKFLNLGYEFNDKKTEANKRRKSHIRRSFDKIIAELEGTSDKCPFCGGNKVSNIFVYFDKMTLKHIINIFYCFDKEIQLIIFEHMKRYKLNLNSLEISVLKIDYLTL